MIDYSKIGLKAGLEIHQQLDTGKLFSRTPSLLRSDDCDYVVMRKLHAVAGEEGEIDEAVKHEAGKDKEFYYEGYNDTISLVELDEEPPRKMDEDALKEVLKIALLLNCEIYPCVQVMRKTVIDGSNTSGFQRTMLIAHDGFVECSFGKIGIETVALEEDAARIISKEKGKTIFRLDRLGIPLVEIATKPELKTPDEIKECALKIGEILRACKVKRGIGTIRQDVNVSIKGHDRVEIKGFQEPRMMIKTVDIEIERQEEEKKNGKKNGEVRNAKEDGTTEFLRPMPGRARMYPETDLELLNIGREFVNKVKKELPKLRTEIKERLEKKGLRGELLELVLSNNKVDEFETLMKINGKAELIGKMITLWRYEFASKKGKTGEEIEDVLNEKILEKILLEVKSESLDEGDVKKVMLDVLEGKSVEEAVKIEKADDNVLEEKIRKIILEKPGLRENAYMGLVMSKMKGKISGKEAMDLIKKFVK